MPQAILLIQLAATLFLTGLIWCIQIVHYPLFDSVGDLGYTRYHKRHMRRITPIVFPPMLAELLTSASMFWFAPPHVPQWSIALGFSLVILIWLSTMLLQVPAHRLLEKQFARPAYVRLCRSNWIRTCAWTVRSALLIWMMWMQLPH